MRQAPGNATAAPRKHRVNLGSRGPLSLAPSQHRTGPCPQLQGTGSITGLVLNVSARDPPCSKPRPSAPCHRASHGLLAAAQALRELCACAATSGLCQEQNRKGPKTHGTVTAMGVRRCGHERLLPQVPLPLAKIFKTAKRKNRACCVTTTTPPCKRAAHPAPWDGGCSPCPAESPLSKVTPSHQGPALPEAPSLSSGQSTARASRWIPKELEKQTPLPLTRGARQQGPR